MRAGRRPAGRAGRAGWARWARWARWTAAAVVGGWLCVAALTACTPDEPTPDAAADALAQGLSAGDLSDVPLTGATPAEATAALEAAVAGLDPWRPAVEVAGIEVSDDAPSTAQARLAWTWDVDAGDTDWTYTTTAPLELVEGAWVARWSLHVVHPDLVAGLDLAVRRVPAERADVLGAGGAVVLVEPRPVLRLGLDKTRVAPADQPASAEQVATVLGLDPAGYVDRVAASGERAFVEALVVREASPGVDLEAFGAIPGALAVSDERPLAPTRTFARPLLGTAGPATAEIVEESGGAVGPDEIVGLSGLQRQYDEQLRGRPGLTVLLHRPDTGDERELFSVPPVPGEPLVTTLEPVLQDAAEAVLADVGPASAVVAIRPSTGAVVAAASGAGGDGYSTATLGTYAPGSVFKIVSALALLRGGHGPDTPVECPATTTVDGRTFHNFPDYPRGATGTITLRTAFAHSCNTAFIGAADLVDDDDRASAAAALGLGVEQPVGFPAFLGAVPTDAAETGGTDHAAAMIGQGRVQASPLAMATVAASVAAGRTVVPWLVGSGPPEGVSPEAPLTEAEAAALRDLMRGVVTDGGARFLGDVPGEPVLAKTGTAQAGSGADLHNHAWLVAVQGDLAVAVFVEDGEYGSTTAGPLLEAFLRAVAGA